MYIFGVHYSYNKKLESEKNLKNYIQKIETVLKIWRMKNLTLEGKIAILKKLTISKITHLASVTVLLNSTITHLNKIHKEFIWNHKKLKIKEKTIINNFHKDGLKDVDIPSKITSLQWSLVKMLFYTNFYELKSILFFLSKSVSEEITNFRDLLIFPNTLLKKCHSFTEKFC